MRLSSARALVVCAAVLVLAGSIVTHTQEAPPSQAPPRFRDGVELFIVRVQVTAARGQPLPDLDIPHVSVRIGSRRPPVLLLEQVPIPTEAYQGGALAFFKPLPHQLSALYLVGIDADDADCREIPRVSLDVRGAKVGRFGWTPKRGCEPPGARIIRR